METTGLAGLTGFSGLSGSTGVAGSTGVPELIGVTTKRRGQYAIDVPAALHCSASHPHMQYAALRLTRKENSWSTTCRQCLQCEDCLCSGR